MKTFLALLLVNLKITIGIPPGFILNVNPMCGSAGEGDYATIRVISDLTVKIDVECGTGSTSGKIGWEDVQTDIKVYYGTDTKNTGNCYFKNTDQDSGLSVVKLKMYWGKDEANLKSDYEKYTVSCLSKASKKSDSANSGKSDGYNPRGIVKYKGGALSGSVEFHIVDIKDQKIDGNKIPLGKKVQLKATIPGENPTPIQIVNCVAEGKDDDSKQYEIIKSGCGDGIIFPNTLGFTSKSGVIRSPYFGLFKLDQDSGIKFSCNITGCTGSCDGSSCTNTARRKRSVDNESLFIMTTKPSTVVADDLYTDETEKDNSMRSLFSSTWTFIMVTLLATLAAFSSAVLVYMCWRQRNMKF